MRKVKLFLLQSEILMCFSDLILLSASRISPRTVWLPRAFIERNQLLSEREEEMERETSGCVINIRTKRGDCIRLILQYFFNHNEADALTSLANGP